MHDVIANCNELRKANPDDNKVLPSEGAVLTALVSFDSCSRLF
jgi:hypothetical protein